MSLLEFCIRQDLENSAPPPMPAGEAPRPTTERTTGKGQQTDQRTLLGVPGVKRDD